MRYITYMSAHFSEKSLMNAIVGNIYLKQSLIVHAYFKHCARKNYNIYAKTINVT